MYDPTDKIEESLLAGPLNNGDVFELVDGGGPLVLTDRGGGFALVDSGAAFVLGDKGSATLGGCPTTARKGLEKLRADISGCEIWSKDGRGGTNSVGLCSGLLGGRNSLPCSTSHLRALCSSMVNDPVAVMNSVD